MREDPSVNFFFIRDAWRAHLLAASATTQNVVATSSGDAEYYAYTKSASRALCAVATTAVAKVVMPRVRVGATDTFIFRLCWCRNRWRDVARVPGRENPADTGTKHLAQREMRACMRRADCQIAGGRSRLALKVAKE